MPEEIKLGSSMPEEFPLHWASDWGEDKTYGLWMAFTYKGVRQCFRWIKPGRFVMGSPENEPERDNDEQQHEVVLTEGFWLAETTCTQELWEVVIGENPSEFKGKNRPVENVSWNECNTFLEKMNSMMDGLDLCLPSEAQWEYACRGGTETPFSFGDNISKEEVNYNNNRRETVEVKSLPCNKWGLYEMHGNVYEWCHDWYEANYDKGVVNPRGSTVGSERVLRGGDWSRDISRVRSAYRFQYNSDNRYNLNDFSTGCRLSRGHKNR